MPITTFPKLQIEDGFYKARLSFGKVWLRCKTRSHELSLLAAQSFLLILFMDLENFKTSLSEIHPPLGISVLLQSLWFDAKGNWSGAHNLVDELEETKAYWVHAYLHRKEGDVSNANYWYRRAGKTMPSYSLQKEWEEIVSALL